MNESSADRAAMLAQAVRLAEARGLTVLARDCESRGHPVDLVAVTSRRTLVMVEVAAAEPGTPGAHAAISTGRLLELMHAGAAWVHEHDDHYGDIQVDILVLRPDGTGEVVSQDAEGAL